MKKVILSFIATFSLLTTVFAGGDDRDRGPVESLDQMSAPVAEKVVVGDQNADTMTLSNTSKVTKEPAKTPNGTVIAMEAHDACEDKLGLSEYNIKKFREGLAGGYLYNIGPQNDNGTEFSPKRWDAYFDCIDKFEAK